MEKGKVKEETMKKRHVTGVQSYERSLGIGVKKGILPAVAYPSEIWIWNIVQQS